MIPKRFAIEYPERCLHLIDAFESLARRHDLMGTFSIMMAATVLIVPIERAKNNHPMSQEKGGAFQAALKRLMKQKWLNADFWPDGNIGDWRFSRIMGDPNVPHDWTDDQGRQSFSAEANTINTRSVDDVLRVLRNALAHGNVLYLDGNGHETENKRVEYLGFLSRYEETDEQRATGETYRLLAVREPDFLPFVRAWATWVAGHDPQDDTAQVDQLQGFGLWQWATE